MVEIPEGYLPKGMPKSLWMTLPPGVRLKYYLKEKTLEETATEPEKRAETYMPKWTKAERDRLLMTLDESSMNIWETYVNLATMKPPKNIIFRFFWSIGVIAQLLLSIATFPAALGAFMMEEAAQTSGMGAWILSQTKDPNVLRRYLDRHMDFLSMAFTASKTLATLSPVSGGAILRYMNSAVMSADAFYQYADYLETQQEAKEEKEKLQEQEEKRKMMLATLRITSSPSEAEILIDGRDTGKLTPETFTDLEPGTYKIRLRKFNRKRGLYDYGLREITLRAGEKREIRITLGKTSKPEEEQRKTQLAATLRVLSSPSNAEIWVDGINTNLLTPETLKNLPPGTHTIKVRKYVRREGVWIQATKTIELKAKEKKEILIPLPKTPETKIKETMKQTGDLEIISTPTGAKIIIDGTDTNLKTPETLYDIPAGKHEIRLLYTNPTTHRTSEKTTTTTILPRRKRTLHINIPTETEGETVKIKKVIDGDTYITDEDEIIRLTNADTPEAGQPGYKNAIDYVRKTIEGKTVQLIRNKTTPLDKFGRTLAKIIIDGEDLGETLIKKGLARRWTKEMEISTLRVLSTPPGANIILNGIETGYKTPITFKPITPDDYEIICYKEDPKTGEMLVGVDYILIKPGEAKEIKIQLTPSG